ncbi:MAG TPA: Si-specific NAD(P)(+) transhydrogenase [Polyangiaceae bacterium]|nr:Si-specific NAD(P)(+) transhydrogenase [Polyangiaceae bacterium]
MADTNAFDLVIIGAGPAGEKAAAQAAYFRKKVLVVECEPEPGGAAVHTGTLPSKTLRETALYLSGYHARELYGVAVELDPRATLQHLMSRKRAIADEESRHFRQNFERHHVEYQRGYGRFVDPHTIAITTASGERTVTGEFVLIATGSAPFRPPDIDFADTQIHDSDEILTIERLPASMIVLGGGVIGCEYACMFAALGTKLTLVDARPEILPFLDLEIIGRLKVAMQNLGVTLVQNVRWKGVKRAGDGIEAALSDGSTLRAEQLLYAAGRSGRSSDLGLERAGVKTDNRGYIPVDAQFRTNVEHVLAAGDIVGFPALASVSMEQGRVAVCHAFGFTYKTAVASQMPYGIYTIPEVSSFGETEETCKEKGIDYVIGRSLFSENPRGMITGDLEGVTKLVVDAHSRKLLGVHVIGERASELVHVGQVAVTLGATVDLFIDMVFNYPTLGDSYKYAAYHCLGELAARAH